MGLISDDDRTAYKSASDALDAIEAQRHALLQPTAAAYGAALVALDALQERLGEPECICEGCGRHVFPGEPWLGGETPLCGACAPTYADLVASPGLFGDDDGEPLTPEAARALHDAHLAAGGSPGDSLATVMSHPATPSSAVN